MKILQLPCHYRQPGGEDLLARQEAALLRSRGHQVREVRRTNAADSPAATARALAASAWNPGVYRAVLREIEAFEPDVMHVQNFWFALSPSVFGAAHRAGVPSVLTLNNYRLICPGAYLMRGGRVCEACLGRAPWRAVAHACYRGSGVQSALVARMLVSNRRRGTWQRMVDGYIAFTAGARRRFIRGGLPPHKVFVKPNALDPDPGPGEGARAGALFVGRLSPEKGAGVLLQAWPELGGAPLELLGDGPERAALQAAACPDVSFAGWVSGDQVLAAMKRAAFLVMPSLWLEGMPMTLVQAMACGLPVVASRLGALAELVQHGETGLLFTPGDARDLACQCRRLLDDPAERRRLGENARRVFEEQYTPDADYLRLTSIYEAVIRARR